MKNSAARAFRRRKAHLQENSFLFFIDLEVFMKLINRGKEGEVMLEGRITAENATELEKALLSLVDRFEIITLNFRDVKYISSAGLRVLKVLFVQMKKRSGEMKLKEVNEMIMEVFELTGFAGVFGLRRSDD